MRKLAALLLIFLATNPTESFEPIPYTVNTKKWSHVLDDHFISITVNPTDLLQGKVFGLSMNSTMAILKGLAPAYVRIGSADTAKYTFKKSRYPNDMVKPEDEYTVTETHWMVFNEVLQSAGLNVIVCLNAAHRIEGTKKWDSRNSLELISFSDSQGYNLTWQLGYEVQSGDELSGIQFGKDLSRLRTILNAFPRYQNAKLIGPDIRVIHKKEDVDFWTDVLVEAGPILDAVTWHPRWPQPSKMKVSENSDLGYEFPVDYLDWDRIQLNKILQRSIFKNAVWIGETKRESTGTFAEGLLWARRLVLAAKLGVEVVMKQPNLMDITHPKPEYWIALLHKRLLGKAVLETRSVTNNTDLTVISHCTNPYYWTDKPEKLQDGPITVYAVNMGGLEQKIQIKGTWSGRSQLLFQYVLTSGSDPDSVFSQMTYLNGEPLMMTDEGTLPDIVPKVKKLERSLTMKLPPYSIGFWVVPEAKVKICQVQPQNLPAVNIETLTPSTAHKTQPTNLKNIEDINQFIVEKLKNPESESDEVPEMKIEPSSSESNERDFNLMAKENHLPRIARRIRQTKTADKMEELKHLMLETQTLMAQPEEFKNLHVQLKLPKATPAMEQRIYRIAEGISDAMKGSTQQHEFDKFLEHAGLKQDFGNLLMAERRLHAPGARDVEQQKALAEESTVKERSRRSLTEKDVIQDDLPETKSSLKFGKKLKPIEDDDDADAKKKQPKELVIPHQPDLKGLEEKYKAILQIKLEDGKRKIDDIKKKIIPDGTEMPGQKIKADDDVTDIQEEIIKKEIELISKAEETVADILNSQKKRQETFEDIILDELNDAKGERINALVEMHRNQKKKENSIRKRQAQAPLTKPLMKTVEYIEKNFNLEPESVRKIKRSLEEKMGEILRNYDTKKSAETKKRMAPSPKEERKMLRRTVDDDDHEYDREFKKERRMEIKNSESVRERPKERNHVRKSTSVRSQPGLVKSGRKTYANHDEYDEYDGGRVSSHANRMEEESSYKTRKTDEPVAKSKKIEESSYRSRKIDEPVHKSRKTEESSQKMRRPDEPKARRIVEPMAKVKKQEESKKMDDMENDSFELFNAKKFEIPPRKSERKLLLKDKEDRPVRLSKKTAAEKASKVQSRDPAEYEPRRGHENRREESYEETEALEESEETTKAKPEPQIIPLKHDKDRRANMLKQITSMVNNMNSNEKDSERLKRNYDEDLSNEFEPDQKPTSLRPRKPRKAEDLQAQIPLDDVTALKMQENADAKGLDKPTTMNTGERGKILRMSPMETQQPEMERKPENIQTTESTPTTTRGTASGKLSKYRKHRVRPSRRLRGRKEEQEGKTEDTVQKKRHLVGIERPRIDLERKRMLKPKFRKMNSDFISTGNELSETSGKDLFAENPSKPMEQLVAPIAMTPQMSEPQYQEVLGIPPVMSATLPEDNQELIKDLEEIIQEQHFLGRGSEVIKDESKTSGGEFSGTKEETEKPMKTEEDMMESKVEDLPTTESEKDFVQATENPKDVATDLALTTTEPVTEAQQTTSGDDVMMTQAPPALAKMGFLTDEASAEGLSSEEDDDDDVSLRSDWTVEDSVSQENVKDTVDGASNRKRRATFLGSHKKGDQQQQQQQQQQKELKSDDSDTDYSSEERITKFKQMIYKRAPNSSKKQQNKNDIRSFGSGLGADEFLKMAGSTMRVMFDDVIPEAYGQTKTKIQNMGLSEYIKEFGRLVQQMRNLDQIFFNIGEAAVKGYIRGNKAEKGPYIQVISRKKREAETSRLEMADGDATGKPLPVPDGKSIGEMNPPGENGKLFFRSGSSENAAEDGSSPNGEYARTGTEEAVSAVGKRADWGIGQPGQGNVEDDQSDNKTSETVGAEHKARLQERMDPEQVSRSRVEVLERDNGESVPPIYPDLSKIDHTENGRQYGGHTSEEAKPVPRTGTGISNPKKHDVSDIRAMLKDSSIVEWLNSHIKDDLRQNIGPWIKTTKDFIQQALTTLQRQRQLSEMLAKDGVNLLRREGGKNLEKREVPDEPKLPVYHMIQSGSHKKRDTQKTQSDESLIRHLRGLHPGVYVVPTDEMTNVRSEQITNEQRPRPGMPNVVTLNIYYDKKTRNGGGEVAEASEPRITQDSVTYYQNKAWNNMGHYDRNNQYVSPIPQELPPNAPIVSPMQMASVYATDPRMVTEVPNSRLIEYPQQMYHYPPVQKVITPVVAQPQLVYNPSVYVPSETTFVPQPPGTKRQWRDFKVSGSGSAIPVTAYNSGWNLQYGTLPAGTRKSPKIKLPSTVYNTKMAGDKKRSVGDVRATSTWTEPATPLWKYFPTSSVDSTKEDDESSVGEEESREKDEPTSQETTYAVDIFAENRKRAKEIKESKELAEKIMKKAMDKMKTNAIETGTRTPVGKEGGESRRKRSVDNDDSNSSGQTMVNYRNRRLVKRSYPYDVEFEDHDILPQWFGTYQEVDNGLYDLPPHIRRSHIMSTPWSEEEEELLSTILDTDDELALIDLDDSGDYYFADENTLAGLSRNARSTDDHSAMIKTNMIFKSPMEGDLHKEKLAGKTNVMLVDKDISPETVAKTNEMKNNDNSNNNNYNNLTPDEIRQQIQQQIQQQLYQQWQQKLQDNQKQIQQQEQQQQQQPVAPQQTSEQTPQTPMPKVVPVQQVLQSQFLQNVTDMLPKAQNDDAFYYFFKYAYDSFVKVMKSMTQLF